MGSALAERVGSAASEIKLSQEVSPDEIARRTDGSLKFFLGRPSSIDYKKLGAWIVINDGQVHGLTIWRGEEVVFELDETVAILGEKSVTFVYPPHRHSRFSGDRRFSWVTISEEQGMVTHDVVVGERDSYPEIMRNLQIAEASELAEEKFHPGVKHSL